MIQLDNRRFIKAYKSFKGMYKVVLYYRVPYRNIFGKLCKKNVVAAYDYSRLTDDQNNFSIFLVTCGKPIDIAHIHNHYNSNKKYNYMHTAYEKSK